MFNSCLCTEVKGPVGTVQCIWRASSPVAEFGVKWNHIFSNSSSSSLEFFSFFFEWRVVALQYGMDFCHTSTWISHGYTSLAFLLKNIYNTYVFSSLSIWLLYLLLISAFFLFLPNLSNLGRVVRLLEGNQSGFLVIVCKWQESK